MSTPSHSIERKPVTIHPMMLWRSVGWTQWTVTRAQRYQLNKQRTHNLQKLATLGHKTKTDKIKTTTQYAVDTTYMQTNTKNVNKTWALLQTITDKDNPNIGVMRKSVRTSQHIIVQHKNPGELRCSRRVSSSSFL